MVLALCVLWELVKGSGKFSGTRKQRIHIKYDLVGFILLDKLIKTERI